MRKLILALLFLFVSLNCFAVTAELKSVTLEESRNLYWVVIEYTMESGEKIENSYPVAVFNIINKTQAEIQQFLVTNVKHQCDNYIAHEFFKNNDTLINKLNPFVGSVITKDTATIEIDTNGDGIPDRFFEIKEDGTYEEVTP